MADFWKFLIITCVCWPTTLSSRALDFKTDHFDQFIEDRVTSGRFSNVSEVMRKLLEQREQENKAKLKWLHAAVRQGIDEIGRGEEIEVGSIEDLA
jgi:putative addiction module CopG family antidote